ncbi:putative toxin-antitoxin system toxin component, PIN family [Dyadobacter psychrotolerans]|uniref:Putative toxin-antitoxin system toxin component, PIN family n=1 Tax=Dyadobacter psychrotolerans TaxID=2541721 RepID=A0A4R5DQY5_9BACT|nr:putative toxin-antitoxin system toxin component, PIN family [Dyadobacter psychrotolerans]TDE14620.1 putative toxin-antitoxin system toxin component, PIN family [Dyadobacter psychrotolerans]
MPNKVSRIILDTNLWISFLISRDFSKLDDLIITKGCVLIFSKELLDEFLEVASRPKFRRYFSQSDVEDILDTIDEFAEFITVKSQFDLCRDVKDNFLLSLSLDGAADFLITGDSDLIDIKEFNNTRILNITDFFNLNI